MKVHCDCGALIGQILAGRLLRKHQHRCDIDPQLFSCDRCDQLWRWQKGALKRVVDVDLVGLLQSLFAPEPAPASTLGPAEA